MRYTRTINYAVVSDGCLQRTVSLSDGRRYVHHCPLDVYQSVAYALEDGNGHTGQKLARWLDLPFSAVDVAFQFLKDRGIIEVREKRQSWAASTCVYEDAMVEYHALRELG